VAITLSPEIIKPLAVRGKGAARLIGVGDRHFRAMDSAGRVPRGMRLGRAKIWSVQELSAWLAAGCPCRDEWERLKEVRP
jgi:hypothetical protein